MPPLTMSRDEYQELGCQYYKQKEYEKAKKAFSLAINVDSPLSLTLLDQRAATHEKLGDLNAALKDSREMIKGFKTDVKGYLRTADILQKIGKPEKALDIYQYGKKNVTSTNKHFMLLQQLHDQLTRKLSPPTAVDPFVVLPAELIDMVISYLNFKNMVRCLQVSKGWKDYLTRRPSLWTQLDFSLARKEVSRAFIREAVKRAQVAVTSVKYHRFKHIDIMRNLASACKQLTSIEIISAPVMGESIIHMANEAKNLKKLILHNEISLDAVTQVLHRRPTLEHAEFFSIGSLTVSPAWATPHPNLRILTLNGSYNWMVELRIDALLLQTPALKQLTLSGWNDRGLGNVEFDKTELTHLVLDNVLVDTFPSLPPTLTHLTLNSSSSIHSWGNAFHSSLPYLTHLSLVGLNNPTPEFFKTFLDLQPTNLGETTIAIENPTPLQSLHLRDIPYDEYFPGFKLLTHPNTSSRLITPALHTLELTGIADLGDDQVENLVEHGLKASTVNLSKTMITGAAIKLLVDKLPLKTLTVDYCQKITSRDAVDYAQARGVAVSAKMGDELRGGRRVRG
ncbi:F-box/TPR repeat-containing protein pof3 [Dendryphion nanum]|uniref:F-box/TPR repeat-containing protein pof3 n=1 Tax=Dendryphion nanum TaxID=256645 RepID=A0A9P9EHL6_9PLEO|nr:F-box/TPR repeat-containing protein pof3 [Dendryphion nanum]